MLMLLTRIVQNILNDQNPKILQKNLKRLKFLYIRRVQDTKLSVIIALYNYKTRHNLSDKGFSELLEIIIEMLPDDNTLPDSLYTTKKFLMEFNLGYEKIDACINDCCLFRKDYKYFENCLKCKISRWMFNTCTKKPKKGVPAKVLRTFQSY